LHICSAFLHAHLFVSRLFLPQQPHFSDRITYNLWEKTKVETLSAVYTKNQNSKTVIKTIIDGGHLGKIIDQK
jgi:hypothetical protein